MAAISTAPRRRELFPARMRWPIGFAIAAVLVFLFYAFMVPNLSDSGQEFIRNWVPLISINEALVWVTCALGLNIVVGYAGLLDLGYVGFFAVGAYATALLT